MKEPKFPIPKEERTEVFKHIKGHNLYSLSVKKRKKEKKIKGLNHSRKDSI